MHYESEQHTHDHDPRILMGPVPPAILASIRRRHPALHSNSFTRRDAVRLMSVVGLASLAGCASGGALATSSTSTASSLSRSSIPSSSSSSSSSTSSSTGTSTTTSSSDAAACSQGISTTEGPYWVDGDIASPLRSDIRADTVTTTAQNGYQGVALTLSFAVYTYAANGCTSLQNARVDIWHCDAQGIYSEEAMQNETTGNYSKDNFLRGYQLTDSSGLVSFTTIFPGWYTSRTTHIHLRIRTYDSSGNVSINSTTQVFFDDSISNEVYSNSSHYTRSKARDTYNADDSIYKAQLMMSVTGSVSAGYINTLYGIGLPFGS
jgi:protocatechuate 3,4-dioxygenase beta subunit